MSWYGSGRKRLWCALNKNFKDNDVNPKIDAVKRGVERFLRETQYDTAVVVRKTASHVYNMPEKIAGDVCEQLKDEFGKFRVGVAAGEYLGSVEEHITHGMIRESFFPQPPSPHEVSRMCTFLTYSRTERSRPSLAWI